MRVLVGYASRFGSTHEIALRIAAALRGPAHVVEVRGIEAITDLARYDAIVLGSGVYDGSWAPDATEFVRRHGSILARRPLWLFSVGSFGDSHPIIGRMMKKEPKEIDEFQQRLQPREYRVFAGVIDLTHWPAWGRWVFKTLGGHAGDNRNWPEIDAWAEHIAGDLAALSAAPTNRSASLA